MDIHPLPQEMPAPKLLKFILQQDQLIAACRQQINRVLLSRQDNLDVLCKKIFDGESTGSERDDYLAKHPNLMADMDFISGDAPKYLDDLAGAIAAANSEPIMFVKTERRDDRGLDYMEHVTHGMNALMETEGEGLMPPPDPYRCHYLVSFGVLDCAELFFDGKSSNAYIVVKSWHTLESQTPGPVPSLEARKITPENMKVYLPSFVKLVLTKRHPEYSDRREVIVGNQNVAAWIAGCQDFTVQQFLQKWLEDRSQDIERLPAL